MFLLHHEKATLQQKENEIFMIIQSRKFIIYFNLEFKIKQLIWTLNSMKTLFSHLKINILNLATGFQCILKNLCESLSIEVRQKVHKIIFLWDALFRSLNFDFNSILISLWISENLFNFQLGILWGTWVNMKFLKSNKKEDFQLKPINRNSKILWCKTKKIILLIRCL